MKNGAKGLHSKLDFGIIFEKGYMDKTMRKNLKYLLVLYAIFFSCVALFACEQEYSDFAVSPFTPQTSENVHQENGESTIFPSTPQTDENVRDVIYNAMLNRDGSCDLSDFRLSESEFLSTHDVWRIINENPAIDYLDTYYLHSQSGIVTKLTFEYKSIPPDYSERLERAVASAMDSIKGQLQENYRQAELVCAISDYIAVNCQYAYRPDGVTPDEAGSSAYSALVDKRAICEGYANAFTLLAQRFGLEAIKVSGIARPDGISHAWNMVKVDGIWYHVDVTWNDPTPDLPGYAGHEYLLLSDKAISGPRGGNPQYHASWDASAPEAGDTRYDDAFWVYEYAPISFAAMNYDEWTQAIANISFGELIVAAVESNTEANIARFGYDAEKADVEIRKLYPYIGYTYTMNSGGIVIKVGDWVKSG